MLNPAEGRQAAARPPNMTTFFMSVDHGYAVALKKDTPNDASPGGNCVS